MPGTESVAVRMLVIRHPRADRHMQSPRTAPTLSFWRETGRPVNRGAPAARTATHWQREESLPRQSATLASRVQATAPTHRQTSSILVASPQLSMWQLALRNATTHDEGESPTGLWLSFCGWRDNGIVSRRHNVGIFRMQAWPRTCQPPAMQPATTSVEGFVARILGANPRYECLCGK